MLHSFTLCLGYFLYLGALHAFHAFLASEYKCGEIIFLPFSPSKGSESTEVMVLCPQLYNGEPSHVLQSTSKHSRKKKNLDCLILLQSVFPSVAGQDLSFFQ